MRNVGARAIGIAITHIPYSQSKRTRDLPNDFDNSSAGKLMGLATKSEAYAADCYKKRKTTLERQR
jgi:hypothetical protein